jgi:hypothetical protein
VFVHVKVYYQKCPDCGATWSAQLSKVKVIRLGREAFICKCNKAWPTGHIEWAHLTEDERRGYFFSQAEVGVLLICSLVPALFGYFVGSHGFASTTYAAAWGFVVGISCIAILWFIKIGFVWVSLRRVPQAGSSIPHGGWPWNW